MNWPNSDSSSSPTGFSSETGAWAERLIESTSSGSMPVTSAISSGGGLAAELGDELALGAADLVELLDDVDRDADRARLVGERAGDRLADPPRRVGRELEALAVVELLRRADEAERALLDEVEERQALVAVVLGDRDDQAQVGLDHLLLGVEVAALDAAREVDLLLRGEQPDLADVLEEQLQASPSSCPAAGPAPGFALRRPRLSRRALLLRRGDAPGRSPRRARSRTARGSRAAPPCPPRPGRARRPRAAISAKVRTPTCCPFRSRPFTSSSSCRSTTDMHVRFVRAGRRAEPARAACRRRTGRRVPCTDRARRSYPGESVLAISEQFNDRSALGCGRRNTGAPA